VIPLFPDFFLFYRMNCLIVDDNELMRAVMKDFIASYESLTLVGECQDTFQAKNMLDKEQVDLILLDIEMPKMNGLEFIKSLQDPPLIILVTARENYAVEAFEHNVVDYLVKPVSESRFMKAINRAQEVFNAGKKDSGIDKAPAGADKDFMFIREKGVITKLKTDDILFIKALGDYVTIHTTGKNFTIRVNLRSIEDKLPAGKFFRLHRSYIVALDKIDTVEQETVFIRKQAVPIGEQQKQQLLEKLNLI
jgi:two-component system, LytTR family, response regulator